MTHRPDLRWCDEDAERSVLGCIMIKPGLLWETKLTTTDFGGPNHGKIFGAMLELQENREEVNPLTVERATGGAVDVLELVAMTDSVMTTEVFQSHERLVREKALERNVRLIAHEVYTADLDGPDLLAKIMEETTRLATDDDGYTARIAAEVCEEVVRDLDLMAKGEKPDGVLRTNIREVDEYMTIVPGGVLTIAARASMGKTSMIRWLIEQVAHKERILWFSTESHRKQLFHQFIASKTGINSRAISGGKLGWEKRSLVKAAAQSLAQWNLWIDDRHSDVTDICREIRKHRQRHGITMVIIDHIQELRYRRLKTLDRTRILDVGLMDIRETCREEPATYLVLASQLNRLLEQRTDRRPGLADLKASGTIEEMTDMAWLLYRESYYDREADPTLSEVGVAKNRGGPVGVLNFEWDPSNGVFVGPLADSWGDVDTKYKRDTDADYMQ